MAVNGVEVEVEVEVEVRICYNSRIINFITFTNLI